jgi:hypothetical protein
LVHKTTSGEKSNAAKLLAEEKIKQRESAKQSPIGQSFDLDQSVSLQNRRALPHILELAMQTVFGRQRSPCEKLAASGRALHLAIRSTHVSKWIKLDRRRLFAFVALRQVD